MRSVWQRMLGEPVTMPTVRGRPGHQMHQSCGSLSASEIMASYIGQAFGIADVGIKGYYGDPLLEKPIDL